MLNAINKELSKKAITTTLITSLLVTTGNATADTLDWFFEVIQVNWSQPYKLEDIKPKETPINFSSITIPPWFSSGQVNYVVQIS